MLHNKTLSVVLLGAILVGLYLYKEHRLAQEAESHVSISVTPPHSPDEEAETSLSVPELTGPGGSILDDEPDANDDDAFQPFAEDDEGIAAEEDEMREELLEQIDRAIRNQIEEDYADFLANIEISAEKKAHLARYFSENKKLQQDLLMMLMEEGHSVEEVMDRQEQMVAEQARTLSTILDDDQMDALRKYDHALPEKNYRKQVGELLEDLSLDDAKRAQIEDIFVREEMQDYEAGRSVNLLQSKHGLDFKPEQLRVFHDLLQGTQNNDPAAIQRELSYEEQRRERIVDQVPEDLQESIRAKLDVSIKMKRNVLGMLHDDDDM